MTRIIAICGALMAGTVFAVTDDANAVLERLKSPATVCVMGDPCSESLGQSDTTTVAASRSGEEVYNGACAACHNSGAAGAPKFADASGWDGRVDKGMETLVKHVVEGYNAMPAMGLCADCSEEEIGNAVSFILDAL
jgi:cytochrome c5